MNILVWNIRGVGNSSSKHRLKHIIRDQKINIAVILEPKVKVENLNKLSKLVNLGKAISSNNNKIWILYDNNWDLDIIAQNDQAIHSRFFNSSSEFVATFVHAKSLRADRFSLWNFIKDCSHTSLPWVVGGDFNAVLHQHEYKGYSSSHDLSTYDFNEAIINCGLDDFNYSGAPFTWLAGK